MRQRAAPAEGEAEKLEEQKRPFAVNFDAQFLLRAVGLRACQQTSHDSTKAGVGGLAALESERDRTDRKFEALTEAGDGDAKSSLACCC